MIQKLNVARISILQRFTYIGQEPTGGHLGILQPRHQHTTQLWYNGAKKNGVDISKFWVYMIQNPYILYIKKTKEKTVTK